MNNEQITEKEYEKMPKAIQDLVDGSEFLVSVRKYKGNFIFKFQDSFEEWYHTYDASGKQIIKSIILPIER